MEDDSFQNELDEIIIPVFEKISCLSRYESVFHRKSSPHKPSAYLLSKLRKYEKLHQRCRPYTKSYNRTLKKINLRQTSSRSECNYIVWIPANGLGNKMARMASTFLYALLTNRVLLVDHGADMANLFCEPFPNTSWLLPKNLPVKNHWKLKMRHSFGRMLNNGSINASRNSPPSYLYLNLDHSNYDLDKKLFYRDETEAFLRKINWLFMLSDQYFAPYFSLNPSYKEEVSKLFPENDYFSSLRSLSFQSIKSVWGLITRFYDAYLAKADQRVGLQIRVFNPKTTPFQMVLNQVLACSLKEKILPWPEVEAQKPEAYIPHTNMTTKAILITSLYSEFYRNLTSYWTRQSSTGEVIRVYQPSHEEYQHFGDNMHNMKAWAEMYMLSLSDVLVTSAWSTFGYVAQGLGGLKPWILFKTDNNEVPNPPCVRDLSIDPCFHWPPTHNNDDVAQNFFLI